jgi:hypothetical protein
MNLGGKWEGKLIDASGATAAIELNLDDTQGKLKGDFALYFLTEDPGCCGPERRLAQTGPVTGRVSSNTGTVRLDYKVTIGLEPTDVRFAGELSETNNHAKVAMVGCYDTRKGGSALSLGGGGAVLWLYAGR